jgi:hypothetical protein
MARGFARQFVGALEGSAQALKVLGRSLLWQGTVLNGPADRFGPDSVTV